MTKKFLITNVNNEVSLLDTEEDNLILFNVICKNNEDSKYIDPDGDTYATIYRDAEATKEIGGTSYKAFQNRLQAN